MSYYIVVEGARAEAIVYPAWISLLNPSLARVFDPEAIGDQCYYLVSGHGYPSYFSVIRNALSDMETYRNIRWLVIAVDAESMTYEEKHREIAQFVHDSPAAPKTRVIVQNACLETWALGNRLIIRRKPRDARVRKFVRYYDVGQKDPEGLPNYPNEDLNRAQFAGAYLKAALRDRYSGLSYTKRDPKVILHPRYFKQLVKRHQEDEHIRSFGDFLTVFSPTQ